MIYRCFLDRILLLPILLVLTACLASNANCTVGEDIDLPVEAIHRNADGFVIQVILTGDQITVARLEQLAQLQNLESLSLVTPAKAITATMIAHIGKLPKLKRLTFSSVAFDANVDITPLFAQDTLLTLRFIESVVEERWLAVIGTSSAVEHLCICLRTDIMQLDLSQLPAALRSLDITTSSSHLKIINVAHLQQLQVISVHTSKKEPRGTRPRGG